MFGSTRAAVTKDFTRVTRFWLSRRSNPTQRANYGVSKRKSCRESIRGSALAARPRRLRFGPDNIPGFPVEFCALPQKILRPARHRAGLGRAAISTGEWTVTEDLQELVPEYFSEIPIDPFDGAPFRYRVRANGQWAVYSVGPNQTDDGGELPANEPKKYSDPGDIVFGEYEVTSARERLSKSNTR